MGDVRILITEGFSGVLFENFPAFKTEEHGGYEYSMLNGLIAEEVAKEIPKLLRSSVTVDYATVDKKYEENVRRDLRSQIRMTPEELRASEKELIKAIFGAVEL